MNCPLCDGEGILLGTLGFLSHCRCRACGITYTIDLPDNIDDGGCDVCSDPECYRNQLDNNDPDPKNQHPTEAAQQRIQRLADEA